jgi:hypothetical protein
VPKDEEKWQNNKGFSPKSGWGSRP